MKKTMKYDATPLILKFDWGRNVIVSLQIPVNINKSSKLLLKNN
jgi:hypothetical protein